jgi:hypothetical protein
MAVNPDFRDLFAALNDATARYLMVGGYAVAFHGQPRFTKDLDIWVDATPENAARVLKALKDFGAPLLNLTETELSEPDWVFQIGVEPNRIDLMTSVDGVVFEEAWTRHEVGSYGGETVPVISRLDLIANKRAAGRPQDLIDVDRLGLS